MSPGVNPEERVGPSYGMSDGEALIRLQGRVVISLCFMLRDEEEEREEMGSAPT